MRADFYSYIRNIEKKKLISGGQNVSLIASTLHSVDVSNMGKNDLKAFIANMNPPATK
jgi:hypothetical protein